MILKLKKIILLSLMMVLFFLPQASSAEGFADEYERQTEAFAGARGAGFEKPADVRIIVAQVIKVFLSIIGVLFLAYAVYAGYLIMTSAGNEEKVTKGKATLRTAVIGVLVILLAYSILYFVSEALLKATQSEPNQEVPGGGSEDYLE
jgi:hypothetical protein